MKSILSGIRSTRGFTLIELLVVIGILGILAAAIVTTIDPLEQFRKAQDANTKNAVVEFVNATTRYYTTNSTMPCDTAGTASLSSAGGAPCVSTLQAENELKAGFSNDAALMGKVQATVSQTLNTSIACFDPTSKSQERDTSTIYTNNGGAGINCVATGGTATNCFWCAK